MFNPKNRAEKLFTRGTCYFPWFLKCVLGSSHWLIWDDELLCRWDDFHTGWFLPGLTAHETLTKVVGSAFTSSHSLYLFLLAHADLVIKNHRIPSISPMLIIVFQCSYIYMLSIKIQLCSFTWPCGNSNMSFIDLIPGPILSEINLFPAFLWKIEKTKLFTVFYSRKSSKAG